MAIELTQGQLDRLYAFWRSGDAAIVPNLRPGIAESDAQTLVAGHPPLELPAELLRWWGWFDGVEDGLHEFGVYIGARRQFISLQTALKLYVEDVETFGEPHLLRHTTEYPLIFAECHPQRPQTARIFTRNFAEDMIQATDSLGELLDLWLGLTDSGAWTINTDGDPEVDEDKIPIDVLMLGIT